MTGATLASLIVLAVATPPADLDVRGTTSCPAPGEVLDRLRPLLAGRGGLPTGTWLRLVDAPADGADASAGGGAPAEIEVRLERANEPAPMATRRIARDGSCAEVADIVAVVLASWGSLYTPVAVTPAAAPPPPAPAPEAETVASATGEHATRRLALGAAGGFVATSGAGLAPMVGIDLELRLGGAAAARITAAGVGEHEMAFGSMGRATWRRLLLLPALVWSARRASGSVHPFMDVSAGPLAGLFLVQGQGFPANASSVTLDLGGAAGARLGLRLASAGVAFWLGGGAWVYARRQEVRVDGLAQTQVIPWWDIAVTAGIAWTPGS